MSDQLDLIVDVDTAVLVDEGGNQVAVPVEGLVVRPVVGPPAHTIFAPRPNCHCAGCEAARQAAVARRKR